MARSTSRYSRSPSSSLSPDEEPSNPAPSTTVCSLCRQRKVKCDRRRPACSYCFKGGFKCEYSAHIRKRGLRAGYASELERRIAIIEQEFRVFKEEIGTSRIGHNQSTAEHHGTSQASEHLTEGSSPNIRDDSFVPEARALPHEVLIELVRIWFTHYHPWHPLLHQPSLEEYLQIHGDCGNGSRSLIFKAIAAVILPSFNSDHNFSQKERLSWSQSLRSHVLFEAISELSFHGLQAMLILTVLDYGNGNLSKFWNAIGICQRLSMQLGLRDMVVNYCINYGKPSIIPPRMLNMPSSIIESEERVRAFWITEVLDSTSTLGVAWNFHIPRPEMNVWTPCEDDQWILPEGLISMLPFGNSGNPGSFSLYVRLVSNELWHVHNFFQQPVDMTIPEGYTQRLVDSQTIDQRLLKWQSEFESIAAASSPSIPNSIGDSSSPSANVILTYCTIDTAIIALYQRLVILPHPIGGTTEVSHQASSRCLQACNHLVSTLRTLEDEDLKCMSPLLIGCVFAAARFYILYSRVMQIDVPLKLDLLKYVLKACGQRWPLAGRLGKVISAATMGQDSAAYKMPLPEPFYDLQYSWPDIDDALQEWAEKA